MAVKKNIEDVQGKDNYPCGQQLLIHNGKVLKDETTLAENKVTEDGFLVVMLSKSKTLSAGGTSSAQPTPSPAPIPASIPAPSTAAEASPPEEQMDSEGATDSNARSSNAPTAAPTYDQAASNLVAGTIREETIQQIMDIGGGLWIRDTVIRALRAAYNNPERAIDYLYSEIPQTAEIVEPVPEFPTIQANAATERGTATTPASGAPNASPLNMFPQESLSDAAAGGLGSLDFLRNNQQFQALRNMVQTNPQILQPMLQELGKQNPELLRLIQDHHAEFLQLLNEPLDGSEGDIFEDQPEQDMPHAISVTQEEQEAIERLEAMGFDRALVIEAFLACDRNEELAINYLLEHAEDNED
ncbi:hypothetical protein SOVF_102330 [Spinacia oleracea]|nr:hypothetical protein SOVF_102330 [Spinacia oleracea]